MAVTPETAATAAASMPLQRDHSVAKHLFFGDILEQNLFPYPQIRAKDRETLGAIVDAIDEFLRSKEKDLRTFDREGEQSADYVQALRDMGLFGLIIGEEYGGLGLSNGAYARVLAQTSAHDSATSVTVGAHSSIGLKGLLLFGNEAQKAKYLPKLASGEMIAAFCLTESGAGSDAASVKTHAKKQADGSWLLNGEKIWISNGGIAGFYTVFARTEGEGGKMSAFIVEAGWPGVSHGHHEDKLGIRGSNTTTVAFSDVRVPAECLLGEEGKGFKVAMAILNNGRTGLGGGAVGGMKALIRLATQQAKDRKQFGKPIIEFGLVREKIAQMTVDCFAAESAVWMLAHYIDHDVEDYSIEAAMSKVFASEAVQRACYESLQIAAGNGFMKEYPYERPTRDTRILSIFEGTNEILRLYVALSGLKDVGASLGNLKEALSHIFDDPIKGFGVLSGYANRRARQRTGFGTDRILTQLSPDLRKVASIYEKSVVELANASDTLLKKYGKRIADQQYQLKRLADIAIDLYVGLCTLSRAASLEKSDPRHGPMAASIAYVFAKQARRRIARNVRAIDVNEDARLEKITEMVANEGRYPWDVF
ncbi:MAG: acyl-CoA dehydrogenase family protein [Xanthomonadaceae bacterium]|jgi:alkylation response protein AidB-like acyl-CoA dehydrogenase|nr:acyl-CoA dehydrogenase family protein [Xanthomonadaceae bacterium]